MRFSNALSNWSYRPQYASTRLFSFNSSQGNSSDTRMSLPHDWLTDWKQLCWNMQQFTNCVVINQRMDNQHPSQSSPPSSIILNTPDNPRNAQYSTPYWLPTTPSIIYSRHTSIPHNQQPHTNIETRLPRQILEFICPAWSHGLLASWENRVTAALNKPCDWHTRILHRNGNPLKWKDGKVRCMHPFLDLTPETVLANRAPAWRQQKSFT